MPFLANVKKKLTPDFPGSIFFILGNEFCERFSYYGMRAVLMLYLTQDLLMPKSDAKTVFHSFTALNYFLPVCGALLADLKWGKFRTIWVLSIVYSIGQVLLATSSIPPLSFPRIEICCLSLFIIATGAGGIKPCVAAFGGDQFNDTQEAQREKFYSIFYFFINVGAAFSMTITPMFRKNVYCFNTDSCYPLAFGFPAILMVLATVIFLLGSRKYVVIPSQGAVIIDVVKCMIHAIKRRFTTKDKREHWLDHAEDEFSADVINDVKSALTVLLVFVPIPMFWALFDQQGSAWTLQSSTMDGRTGSFIGEIKPDQMDSLNAILVIVLIPFFTYVVYPFFDRIGILQTPLKRVGCGLTLAAVSFFIAGFVQLPIESRFPRNPETGKTEVVFHNGLPCDVDITFVHQKFTIPHFKTHIVKDIGLVEHDMTAKIDLLNCLSISSTGPELFAVDAHSGIAHAVLLRMDSSRIVVEQSNETRQRNMQNGKPLVRFIRLGNNLKESTTALVYKAPSLVNCTYFSNSFIDSAYSILPENIQLDLCFVNSFNKTGGQCPQDCGSSPVFASYTFDKGGIFTAMLIDDGNKTVMEVVKTGEPDSVYILNQVPQYVLLTVSEVMVSITCLSFAYAEAPDTMKSIFQAMWLITVAMGNVIVLIVDPIKRAVGVTLESTTFFLYASLLLIDIVLFIFISRRYHYKSSLYQSKTK